MSLLRFCGSGASVSAPQATPDSSQPLQQPEQKQQPDLFSRPPAGEGEAGNWLPAVCALLSRIKWPQRAGKPELHEAGSVKQMLKRAAAHKFDERDLGFRSFGPLCEALVEQRVLVAAKDPSRPQIVVNLYQPGPAWPGPK